MQHLAAEQPPTRLLSASFVLPIVAPPIADGAVAVDAAGTVRDVGPRTELRQAYGDLPETRASGTIMPGLVNAHTHLELAALAGAVAGGDGLVAWTRRLAAALATLDTPTREREAVRGAEAERRAGAAAIGDVGNGTAGWRAMARVGLGGLFFHELLGSRDTRTGDALGDAVIERAAAVAKGAPIRVSAVPAPHALYSCSPRLLRRIFAAAAEAHLPTSVHVAEDADEIALLRNGTGGWVPVLEALGVTLAERTPGVGPLAYLEQVGAFRAAHRPLLVHMVHADADDRRRARECGATIVLCPRSNLHIGGRLPDARSLVTEGCALALGSDSLASVSAPGIWGDVALLATHYPDIAPRVWLHAATAGGAKGLALSGPGGLGGLGRGMRPGIIDVKSKSDERDPERALVSNPSPEVRWLVLP